MFHVKHLTGTAKQTCSREKEDCLSVVGSVLVHQFIPVGKQTSSPESEILRHVNGMKKSKLFRLSLGSW